jgi:carbonic anhydrase
VQDVRERHEARIAPLAHDSERIDRLCELNVIDQVRNVCHTTILRDAWDRGQAVMVHGWVYGLKDGLVRDLGVGASSLADAEQSYQTALASVA